MRLPVEQLRQRLLTQRPGYKIGHTPPGIADAVRPPERVAGAALREAPARVACGRQKGIRTKRLRFQDSAFRKQERAGRIG